MMNNQAVQHDIVLNMREMLSTEGAGDNIRYTVQGVTTEARLRNIVLELLKADHLILVISVFAKQ